MYRFSTIFATDRGLFNCISMHCSRKWQLLLCESSFRKSSWIAPRVVFWNRFTVLTFLPVHANAPLFVDVHTDCEILGFLARLCTTQNVCPFAESSFWYQDLQLLRVHLPRQQILTNQTVNDLLYFEIDKVKDVLLNLILNKVLSLGNVIAP